MASAQDAMKICEVRLFLKLPLPCTSLPTGSAVSRLSCIIFYSILFIALTAF